MPRIQGKWRTTLLVTSSVAIIFATGVGAGRLLEMYDANIGFQREASRIAEVLDVQPGMEIGDVRAGRGNWSVDLAKRVGPEGLVYATSSPTGVNVLFKTVADSGVDNISVIVRTPEDNTHRDNTRLPVQCCDRILVRHVYHDFQDRRAFAGHLLQNLRPGGLLAVIDRVDVTNPGMPTHPRISPHQAIAEITSAGFELVNHIDAWSATSYCLVFRRPPGVETTAPAQ